MVDIDDNKSDYNHEDQEMDEEFNDDVEETGYPLTSASKEEHNQHDQNSVPPETGSSDTQGGFNNSSISDLPDLSRKDKTLKEVLDLMEGDFSPIIPDAVTDFYLAKNGFETSDIRIKRLLALATQKFILDISQDAYEYSRIRSASAVYNSANPQVRAKQLMQSQQYANQQLITGSGVSGAADGQTEHSQVQHSSSNAGNQQGKIVLTMEDLSGALSEYGFNASRPDFYR